MFDESQRMYVHRDSGALRLKDQEKTNANDFNITNQKFRDWFNQTENEQFNDDGNGSRDFNLNYTSPKDDMD